MPEERFLSVRKLDGGGNFGGIEIGNSIKEYVDLWRRGTSDSEMSVDESAIFAILVNQVDDSKVMGFLYSGEIEGYESGWTNRVHPRLEILDRERPPVENKPFVAW